MSDIVLDPLLADVIETGAQAFVLQWLVAEGDHVSAWQPLARVDLSHRQLDLTAPHAGVLEEILIPAGERFDRGTVLARLIPT